MNHNRKVLITGGSGYLGEVLATIFLKNNWQVRILDINSPDNLSEVEFLRGDIRDQNICNQSTEGVDVVVHAVAQVPLARDKELFTSVNIEGTRRILNASKANGVRHFIYISSSAIYGIPDKLPVTINSAPNPIEDYGKAKLYGEVISLEADSENFHVSIVRPRTILGQGRLGIFSILFDWVSQGLLIFTLGDGKGKYQFIHVSDLSRGIFKIADLNAYGTYNLGALHFASLKEDLQSLCLYSNTNSKVKSLPNFAIRQLFRILSLINFLPFAEYQLKLYSKEMYFDSTDDWNKLGINPQFSNVDALIDSYNYFLSRKDENREHGKSHHQKPVNTLGLRIATGILRIYTKLS